MDESITRAAGGINGQAWDADRMTAIARTAGRFAMQRTPVYQPAAALMTAAELRGCYDERSSERRSGRYRQTGSGDPAATGQGGGHGDREGNGLGKRRADWGVQRGAGKLKQK